MTTRHVALICDDNYCFPTIVCIQSLINNAVNNNYIVHVCTFGLSEANVNKLKMLNSEHVTIEVNIFNYSLYEERLKQVSAKTHVSPTALIKFELPNYFSNLDSLLYLDSDIIIKDSVDSLFDTKLDTYYLAASYDFFRRLNKINYSFKRDYDDFYFNSGVMLLNLKLMRDDDVTSKLWYYKMNCTKTKLMDQETLNAICGNKALSLSLIWNFNPVFCNKRYLEEINNVYNENFFNIEELEKNVKIVHYVGKPDKPWIYKKASFRKYWDSAFKTYNSDSKLTLHLQEYRAERPTKIQSIRSKIKLFGITGLMCFIVNSIFKKTLI